MATFDFVSLIIGLLLGAIITLILVWISYFTRSFLFTYCASSARPCGGADYYNDPGDALANNPRLTAEDILFLNDQNQMFYKRVPKITNCTPESNQIVYMKFPEYCTFSDSTKTNTYLETSFNSNVYDPVGFVGPTVTTEGNCSPSPDSGYTSGTPIIKWNSNPIS